MLKYILKLIFYAHLYTTSSCVIDIIKANMFTAGFLRSVGIAFLWDLTIRTGCGDFKAPSTTFPPRTKMLVLQPCWSLCCLSQMRTNKANLANWLDVWAKLLYGLMDVGGGPSQRCFGLTRGNISPLTPQNVFNSSSKSLKQPTTKT